MNDLEKAVMLKAAEAAARFAAFTFKALDKLDNETDGNRARKRFDEQFQAKPSDQLDSTVTMDSVTVKWS